MQRHINIAVFFVGTTFCLAACGPKEEPLKIPTAPDMTEVLRDYKTPTAPINAETMESIIQSFQEWSEYRNLVCGTDPCKQDGLFCALCPGMRGLDCLWDAAFAGGDKGGTGAITCGESDVDAIVRASGTVVLGGSVFEGDGYIHASRPCEGDPDGNMDLTLVISDEGINPVVWGKVQGCDADINGEPARFDVEYRLSLSGEVDAGNISTEELGALHTLVLWINGDVASEGKTNGLTLDIKTLIVEDEVQLRIPVNDKHVIYFWNALQQGFEAANGRWICDFSALAPGMPTLTQQLECTNKETGTVVDWPL